MDLKELKFVDCEMCKCKYRNDHCKIINTNKCKRIKKRYLIKKQQQDTNGRGQND